MKAKNLATKNKPTSKEISGLITIEQLGTDWCLVSTKGKVNPKFPEFGSSTKRGFINLPSDATLKVGAQFPSKDFERHFGQIRWKA